MRRASLAWPASSAVCIATFSSLLSLAACGDEQPAGDDDGGGTGGQPSAGKGGGAGASVSGSGGSSGGSSGATGAGGGKAGAAAGGTGGTGVSGSAAGGAGNGSGGKGGGLGGGGASNGGSGGTPSAGNVNMQGGAGGKGGAGSGGAAEGGTSGTSSGGSGGGSAGSAAVDKSAGCGKAPPQPGSAGSPLNIANHQYYVKPPMNYDNATPYRLIFGFHPSGNPIDWAEKNLGFDKTDAATQAIMVYPKSAGNGWEQVDIALFDPLYDQIVNNYCVDKARVFATGESSGGDYSSVLGCEKAEKVRAVGPTAAKPMAGVGLNPSSRTCVGIASAYVIHGKMDSVVGAEAGIQTRDFHLAKNNCGTMTVPVEGYTDTLSNCVEYQGCDEGYPVFWCQHTDPEYSNTNHGWPKFAGRFLWEQFSKY
jgi:polyhydroxybutyrate depolymerase